MSVLKYGLHIGICTNNVENAKVFMKENFNIPDRIIENQYQYRFEYNDKDFVEWVNCSGNSKGRRYDKLFVFPDVNQKILDVVIKPFLTSNIEYIRKDY